MVNYRLFIIPLFLFAVAHSIPVFSQVSKKYKPRTLADVLELNRKGAEGIFATGKLDERQDFIGIDPTYSKVAIQLAGARRPISDTHRNLMNWWFKLQSADKKFLDLYQNEILFKEGNVEYWIPCQDKTADLIVANFKTGDTINLLVMYIGAHRDKNEKNYSSLIISTGYAP
jgi:hypothetical protein